ncbi:MAG: cysteine desulfurase [SAR324 cluster bacterium]|nr:cysteine desulfurase [SAR324 cluster bacterium]
MFYLDHAATTPVFPEVLTAALPYLNTEFFNPSSLYSPGVKVSRFVKTARERIAHYFGVSPGNVVFCSGATESNFMAFMSTAFSSRLSGQEIVISAIEHPSVTKAAEFLKSRGFEIKILPIDHSGTVDLSQLLSVLSSETRLVSCMAVNNEIGTLQPLELLGKAIKQYNPKIMFHVDATQAVGKIPLSIRLAEIDMLSLSGHKLGAPKGIGALIMRRDLPVQPLMEGGGQENGWRGGTENVFGIVALEKALTIMEQNRQKTSTQMIHYKQKWLDFLGEQHPDLYIYTTDYVQPFYLNFGIPQVPAEVFLHHLEAKGIFVSTGSACSSRKSKVSPVWELVGVPQKKAKTMIRLSFGYENLEEDQELLFKIFSEVIRDLRT